MKWQIWLRRLSCMIVSVALLSTALTETGVGASSSGSSKGIGATLSAFTQAHGEDHNQRCSLKNVCFGPLISNSDSGEVYEYTAVVITRGIVTSYWQSFPTHTTLASAQRQMLTDLPGVTHVSKLVLGKAFPTGTCGFFNIHDSSLAKTLGKFQDPSGTIGVEVSYGAPDGNSAYSPGNVQSAVLLAFPYKLSDGC
ncbi:MAG TPA: hypothetical protein VII67_03950 [Acidimicrobiales bacterium]